MFSRQFRLPATVRFHESRYVSTSFFALRFAKNTLKNNRYGFIVSKKIDNRATIRNRLKRRFRACVETLHSKIEQGNDFLFILKNPALEIETEVLQKEITKILSEQNLLKK